MVALAIANTSCHYVQTSQLTNATDYLLSALLNGIAAYALHIQWSEVKYAPAHSLMSVGGVNLDRIHSLEQH